MLIKILSYIKPLFFCLRHFKFSIAIKIPVLIGFHTKIHVSKQAQIILSGKVHRAMLSIGNGGSAGVPVCKDSNFIMNSKAKLIIKDSCSFGEGCNIRIEDGCLNCGNMVSFNKNVSIYVSSFIDIGSDSIFGWNNTIFDGTGHHILIEEKEAPFIEPIEIGSLVWCGAFVTVLKGTIIPRGCIVGYGSIVTKAFEEEKALLVGVPAKIVRHNITWKK